MDAKEFFVKFEGLFQGQAYSGFGSPLATFALMASNVLNI